MLWLANTAEGGTSGTAISTANSGGGSGDALDVLVGASGTRVFDNTQAAHGLLSYKLINAVGATNYIGWTVSMSGTEVWGVIYARFPSFTTETLRLMQGQAAAGACAIVNVTSAGKIAVANSSGTVLATSTAAMSVNTWYRIEFYWNLLSASGTNRVSFYTLDGVTPVETVTGSGNLRSAITEIRLGSCTSATTAAHTLFFDDLGLTDVQPGFTDTAGNSYIGPAHNKMTLPTVTPVAAVVRANQW